MERRKNKDSGKFIALLLIHLILVSLDNIRSLPKFLSVFDFFVRGRCSMRKNGKTFVVEDWYVISYLNLTFLEKFGL